MRWEKSNDHTTVYAIMFASSWVVRVAASELPYEANSPALTWSPEVACIMSSMGNLCFSTTGIDKSRYTRAIACMGGTECGTLFDQIHIREDGAGQACGIVVEKVMDTTTLNHCKMRIT